MQCASEQTERPDETYVKRRVQRALAREQLATEGTPATSAGDGDVRVSMETMTPSTESSGRWRV